MSASTVFSLAGFTAYDLPREKWLKLVCPKVRLLLRGKGRSFVTSAVKVGNNEGPDVETDVVSCTHWPWNDDGRSSRPLFAGGEAFEIAIERRFLFGYKCIRRTRFVRPDQAFSRDRDTCSLPLYDGHYSAWQLGENNIEMGRITFTRAGAAERSPDPTGK